MLGIYEYRYRYRYTVGQCRYYCTVYTVQYRHRLLDFHIFCKRFQLPNMAKIVKEKI